MQRGRLGGIPLPRTFPIRGGGIGSIMVVVAKRARLVVMSSTRHMTNIKT